MTFEHVERFVAIGSVGGGLLLAGGLQMLLGNRPRARVAAAVGSVALSVGGVAAWTENWILAGSTAAILIAILLVGLCLGSRRFAVALVAARRAWSRRIVRSGSLTAVGLLFLVGAAVGLEVEQSRQMEQDAASALFFYGDPPARQTEKLAAITDRGHKLELTSPITQLSLKELKAKELRALDSANIVHSVIRRGPANEQTNCFGWVFADGRYWLSDKAIDPILKDNGYRTVAEPQPGDVVIYRSPTSGQPTHVALVRYVTEGLPVMAESKFGWLGVFLHEVDRTTYGTEFAYYRSPRPTHRVAFSDSDPALLTGAE